MASGGNTPRGRTEGAGAGTSLIFPIGRTGAAIVGLAGFVAGALLLAGTALPALPTAGRDEPAFAMETALADAAAGFGREAGFTLGAGFAAGGSFAGGFATDFAAGFVATFEATFGATFATLRAGAGAFADFATALLAGAFEADFLPALGFGLFAIVFLRRPRGSRSARR